MKLEVLVATMNRQDLSFLEGMNIQTNTVVINQCQEDRVEVREYRGNQVKWLSYNEKGLSKSRNRALAAATGDICLIADDDLIYENGYEEKILEAYRQYPKADLIAFQIRRTGKERLKQFRNKASRENWFSSMKISSVEITFKRRSIEEKGIRFNTLFGAGAYFYSGEENIFLYDCLRKHLKIMYVPIEIGSVCCDESSWFEGYTPHYFKSMGAAYYGMSRRWSRLITFQHLVRHYKLYKKDMSFTEIAGYMREGRKECKKLMRNIEGKTKSFIIGDFKGCNGPSIVNQNLMKEREELSRYSSAKTKFGRVLEVIIKSIGADAIGFSGLSQINRLGLKWAKLLHKPTFYIMHGYVAKELMLEGEQNPKLIALEQTMLNQVDQIIPVSKNFQDYLEKEFPEYKKKFSYINNGIDWESLKKVHIDRNESQKEYIVTSIGGGIHRKNNLAVCEAIEKIKGQLDQPIKYRIIGKAGKDIEAICKYQFVEYLGQVSHIDVLNLLGGSQIYVQNSYLEPFSLAVVEALMCGCDVLVSKEVGALSILKELEAADVVQNNEDVEEIADKLLIHLKHSNNKRLMAQINPRETSWEATSHQLTEIIGKL